MNTFLLASAGGHSEVMLQTMVTAISGGVLLILLARRLGIPSIVALLAGGVLLGPQVWGDAAPIQPASLGDGLGVTVALAVSVRSVRAGGTRGGGATARVRAETVTAARAEGISWERHVPGRG